MNSMDYVKKRIIISMISIVLLLLTLFGITYAYFTAKVKGNSSEKSASVSAGKLQLKYYDGNGLIEIDKIIPGTVIETKTFSVENTGTLDIDDYDVILENVVNELLVYQDLTYELTCTSDIGECKGSAGVFPKDDSSIVTNYIKTGETQSYSLKITYNETNTDQSDDMNKKIEAKVNIIDELFNRKVLVYGNSVQDGIPSIDNPVEVQSVGDKTNNLFDDNNAQKGMWISTSGSIVASDSQKTKVLLLELEDQKDYTIYAKWDTLSSNNIVATACYDSNKAFIAGTRVVKNNVTEGFINKTCPSTSKYIGVASYFTIPSQISIVKGTYSNSDFMYEPFGYKIPVSVNGKVTNVYLNEPLRKIGDYADYLDLKNKKVVRKTAQVKMSDLGSYSSLNRTTSTVGIYRSGYFSQKSDKLMISGTDLDGYCSTLPNYKGWASPSSESIHFAQVNRMIYFYSNLSDKLTRDEIISHYGNPDISYILETPIEESINVDDIEVYFKNDKISVGTSIQPSKIEIE